MKAKDLSNEDLATILRSTCMTGICPSRDEKEYLQEAADRLEQEPCDDAISREELLKAIETWDKFGVDDTNSLFRLDNLSLPHYVPYIHYDDVIKCIKGMPSVTQKSGKWIPVSERLPEIADVYRVTRYYPNNVMNPKYLVDACAFDGFNTWYNDNRINHERAYADNIIAWQENPEPYEPQESENKE